MPHVRVARTPGRQAPARKAPARLFSAKGVGASAFVGVALAFFGFALVYQSDADANVADASVAGIETVAAVEAPRADKAAKTYAAVLDPSYSLGGQPSTFSGATPRGSRLQLASLTVPEAPAVAAPVEPMLASPRAAAPLPPPRPETPPAIVANVPLPIPRPAAAQAANGPSADEIAQSNKSVALATPRAEDDSIFKKLFGVFQGKGPTLAFASPDGGVFSDGSSMTPGKYDRYTAVYDISAKTVYMPDGRKLEAHSGLGSRLDDPRFVHERMRGATPPHLYDLSWREKPFHGVRAIRLNPVGGNSSIYGRTGLLAHTYMLGPNGDSNGCVSFKDYNAFIKAFESGQIKRLAVVAKL
ncbi:MAG: tlde1 domain-containing protein [Xanthobacteraceae bacterium]